MYKRQEKPVAVKKKAVVAVKPAVPVTARTSAANVKARRGAGQFWDEPTYKDSTVGDNVDGEDLTVRQAAVEALGPMNGAVVVVDPDTGRILTVVNQTLAFGTGFPLDCEDSGRARGSSGRTCRTHQPGEVLQQELHGSHGRSRILKQLLLRDDGH